MKKLKILMIGAHQDDAEFRGGGLAALYAEGGHEVRFLSMCNGSGGHHEMTPEETTARRAKESARVAELLGIRYDVWSDQEDCAIVADIPTRRRLIRYIRSFAPDMIIAHRTNDYHADHRASALLVQDAAYLLTVPHECPDVPFMRTIPVILFYEDHFRQPPFVPAVAVDIGRVIDKKLAIAENNVSQVFEWLPFNDGVLDTVPPESDPEARHRWFMGPEVTEETSDRELLALCGDATVSDSAGANGYAVLYAKTAADFRDFLIREFGEEKGGRIRFAEVFSVSEYGSPLTEEKKRELFPF